jgi:hypothetical protein
MTESKNRQWDPAQRISMARDSYKPAVPLAKTA